eukprot:8236062-Alexandrium_andersonii.AAC.1
MALGNDRSARPHGPRGARPRPTTATPARLFSTGKLNTWPTSEPRGGGVESPLRGTLAWQRAIADGLTLTR